MTPRGDRAAGLLLAAGTSSRMGTPKQLLPIRGQTLLGGILAEALQSDLDCVILVLGHDATHIREILAPLLDHPTLQVVDNPRYAQGISTSIVTGLRAVEKDYDHVMILLGDMPQLTCRVINTLLERYLASHLPMGAIAVKGRRSHPVVVSRPLYAELHELRGDVGARALFRKYHDQVCLVAPEGPYDDRDIDTPEEYAALQQSLPQE